MKFESDLDLPQWLRRLEQLHPVTIELGLDRVRAVYERMAIDFGDTKLVIVGGTNGKGSTCTMLTRVLMAAGKHVGTYTSPHLLRYNERVTIDGREASDDELCAAFAAVEAVRGDVSLTYFEFGTLAALHCFAQRKLDVVVLEVGLGGRLDAVNIVEPDVSILTNVALDHMDWLGDTREKIGFEKAGIFRAGRPAIYGETDMPETVGSTAAQLGARLLRLGRDYSWQRDGDTWRWEGQGATGERRWFTELPLVPFPLDNAAAMLQALMFLDVPFTPAQLRKGLLNSELSGRFQELQYKGRRVIADVAHNPHAAANLAVNIRTRLQGHPVRLVIGMLNDKDSGNVVRLLAPLVAQVYAATLLGERGSPAEIIYNHARESGVSAVTCHDSVAEAFEAVCAAAGPDDVVVVTGSFFTVAAVLEHIRPATKLEQP
ncbi:MAG: bifunctional tetrahydrofolate synthase/dihydrofolate synthase [Gammaproteobacteria bacterium]